MLVGCRWVSVAPANVSGKDVDCRSRARPGHPAGARTIVGRSNLGASPEAIKAVPRLRGADGCFAPRWMVPKPAPASAGRMVVLPSKPRSGDAIVAPHRARHERWCGVCGIVNFGPRRGPIIPSPRARISRIVRPLRGRGRDESNPPHTVARTSLDVGLQLHRRLAAQIPPRGRPLHRVYVVPTRPALRGARERSPEACLGVNRPTPPIRPPNGGRGLPAPPPRNSGTMRGAKLSYNPITL